MREVDFVWRATRYVVQDCPERDLWQIRMVVSPDVGGPGGKKFSGAGSLSEPLSDLPEALVETARAALR